MRSLRLLESWARSAVGGGRPFRVRLLARQARLRVASLFGSGRVEEAVLNS